jgi:hypothetical protein
MIKRKLMVNGHGRGATSFCAHWLQYHGCEVHHEAIGPDGIVESGFSVPTWLVRKGSFVGMNQNDFDFDTMFTIVRNPWKVISTYEAVEHPMAILGHFSHLPSLGEMVQPEQAKGLAENRVLRVNLIAHSVVRWTNMGAAYTRKIFRAEDQMPDVHEYLTGRGIMLRPLTDLPKNKVNHRAGNRLTKEEIWDMLDTVSQDDVAVQAQVLGYE